MLNVTFSDRDLYNQLIHGQLSVIKALNPEMGLSFGDYLCAMSVSDLEFLHSSLYAFIEKSLKRTESFDADDTTDICNGYYEASYDRDNEKLVIFTVR